MTGHSAYFERVQRLADEAARERESFDTPARPPDDEQAMEYLRDGLGSVVLLYVEARTGEEYAAFSTVEYALLQRAMNDWLSLYARCYGVDIDPDRTLREAAELLVETHNIHDVAQLLTGVPDRHTDRVR